jgi:hypothetical protein
MTVGFLLCALACARGGELKLKGGCAGRPT